ncbi:hypothetical protein ACVWYN_002971 [Pedobacter sp. UYP24]
MKLLLAFLMVTLVACGPTSSPEKRSKIRDQDLKVQIDSLKLQNSVILNRLDSIQKRLSQLEADQSKAR